ncbi:hypothetical protein HHO41_02250 [Bacillus sp. DNRA2]|uniref:FliH/SctL family protein n=1 Tax=Bacillus sp. DNRA2 TaxID=2723053 RepID=UPI00145F1D70|nr:FliH/SctL family protein [Bacillus sp. DNRA2]NMD69094.1 hypothetical protein [Bacillus sp. DNRA2]
MISYSKIFKASQLELTDEVRVIKHPKIELHHDNDESTDASQQEVGFDEDNIMEHPHVLAAAEQAQAIIAQADETMRALERETEEKMKQWWQENHEQLEVMKIDATHQGYEDGYLRGKIEAEAELREAYQEKITQAQQIIEAAYHQKEAIVAEAEPFLLELSTAIASQIIRKELTDNPEKYVELIQQHILRFKEKEYITICVHPDDFDYIQSQHAHIASVVAGETEIKIIPDHSVTSKGVVIRTAYGSIDARIDTQIEEIKKAILEMGRE